MLTPNQIAFLCCPGFSEGTDKAADPYRVCYGYKHTIVSFADHPAITGEWHGEPLDKLGPSYAGKFSTAAGRYQIIKHTWIEARDALEADGVIVPGFTPDAQDMAALWLAEHRASQPGVLDDIEAGRIATAIAKCSNIWASFPGANAPGQPMRDMGRILATYTSAGGMLLA